MRAKWTDFCAARPIKHAGANDPPISVSRSMSGGQPRASYSPSVRDVPIRRKLPTFEKIPEAPAPKKWLGLPTFTIEDEAKHYSRDSDQHYHNILVGGANAGGRGFTALSALPFGILARGNNKEVFRNGDIEGIERAIRLAQRAGKNVRVFGHSWGGSDVANLAKKYPGIPFYALDPVSWTNVLKEIPENLTIYRPDNKVKGMLAGFLAQKYGHQWPVIKGGKGRTVIYHGNHVDGLSEAMTALNDEVMNKRLAEGSGVAPASRESADPLVALGSAFKKLYETGSGVYKANGYPFAR